MWFELWSPRSGAAKDTSFNDDHVSFDQLLARASDQHRPSMCS